MIYLLISLNFNNSLATSPHEQNQYSILQQYSPCPYGISSMCLTGLFNYLQVVNKRRHEPHRCETRQLKRAKKWCSYKCHNLLKILNITWQLIYVVLCTSKIHLDI